MKATFDRERGLIPEKKSLKSIWKGISKETEISCRFVLMRGFYMKSANCEAHNSPRRGASKKVGSSKSKKFRTDSYLQKKGSSRKSEKSGRIFT